MSPVGVRTRRHLKAKLLSRITVVPETGCWEYGTRRDYQQVYYRGRARPAHRLALYAWKGFSLTSSLLACHTCDNRPCVNPDHLFPGTSKDNTDDCMRKGRWMNVGHPKVTSKWDGTPMKTVSFHTTTGILRKIDKHMKRMGYFNRSSYLNWLLSHIETEGHLLYVFPRKKK